MKNRLIILIFSVGLVLYSNTIEISNRDEVLSLMPNLEVLVDHGYKVKDFLDSSLDKNFKPYKDIIKNLDENRSEQTYWVKGNILNKSSIAIFYISGWKEGSEMDFYYLVDQPNSNFIREGRP